MANIGSRITEILTSQININSNNRITSKLDLVSNKINTAIRRIAHFGNSVFSRQKEFLSEVIPAKRPSNAGISSTFSFTSVESMKNSVKKEVLKNMTGENSPLSKQYGGTYNDFKKSEGLKELKKFKVEIENHMGAFNKNLEQRNAPSAKENVIYNAEKIMEILQKNPQLAEDFKKTNPNFEDDIKLVRKELKIEGEVKSFLNSVDNSTYFTAKQSDLVKLFTAIHEEKFTEANKIAFDLSLPTDFDEIDEYDMNPKNNVEFTKLHLGVLYELFLSMDNELAKGTYLSMISEFLKSLPEEDKKQFLDNHPDLNIDDFSTFEATFESTSAQEQLDLCQYTMDEFAETLKKLAGENGVELGSVSISTPDESKQVYNKMARSLHPDRGGDVEEFKKLGAAYAHFCFDLCDALSISVTSTEDAIREISNNGGSKYAELKEKAGGN